MVVVPEIQTQPAAKTIEILMDLQLWLQYWFYYDVNGFYWWDVKSYWNDAETHSKKQFVEVLMEKC